MAAACALHSDHSPSTLEASPTTSMWAAVSTSLWAHLSVGLCLDWFTGSEQESYAGPDRWKQLQSGPGSPFAKARPGHNGDSPSRWDEEEDWGSCCTPPPAHRCLARTSTPRSALRTPGSSGSMRHSASMLRSVSFSCDKVRASSPTVCATVALALHACRRRCRLLSARLQPSHACGCSPGHSLARARGGQGAPLPPHRPPRPPCRCTSSRRWRARSGGTTTRAARRLA